MAPQAKRASRRRKRSARHGAKPSQHIGNSLGISTDQALSASLLQLPDAIAELLENATPNDYRSGQRLRDILSGMGSYRRMHGTLTGGETTVTDRLLDAFKKLQDSGTPDAGKTFAGIVQSLEMARKDMDANRNGPEREAILAATQTVNHIVAPEKKSRNPFARKN